ncbi:uncharacterized protein LOC107822326 [Nicotiana tabacum]|uniref:Uncharacterized protein LOC107822326 n=1 Tax=Nicotiana tabacum TaxID=4097 RepID=A0A1S4CTA1_TOBAC|nr:PREDICTED: uncharacterized protein LOC107822326 [Nicotiana tabacum]
MGGIVEEGYKSSKIMSYSAIKATTQAIQNGTGDMLGKKKKDDVAMRLKLLGVLRTFESKLSNPPPKNLDYSLRYAYCSDAPGHDIEKCWHLRSDIQELIDTNQIEVQILGVPNINQNPLPAHAETHMIDIVYKDGKPEKPSKSIMIIRASESNSVKTPIVTSATSSTVEGLTDKLSKLDVKPSVVDVKGSPDNAEANQGKLKVVMSGIASKHVIIVEGARTTPIVIKLVTQLPVDDTKVVLWNYKQVIVTYKGKEVEEEVNETRGLTRSGRCFALEELGKAKPLKDSPILVKKPVTKEEAEEFLRKMKVQDYSIVEQLRKTPAQIYLLLLLIHLDEHRRALMKILNEAHVPDKIIINHLEKIANKILDSNKITFSDDELPLEGAEHNRALYLIVKYEDSMVTRVLVDNGSSANIFPLSSLHKLKIDAERIHKNSICVRGFDEGGKDSVGDIVIELTIGPVEFTMEFQVLDMVVSYNLLLGRPWIHVAKAVPSSLHQMVEDNKGPWVYQFFKTVSVEKVPEEECIPGPKLASATVMVENKMLKNGFCKGLGASLQGIVQPVSLRENLGTFGLGFKPTWDDVKKAKKLKKKAWVLPKPIPCLSRSFVKSGVVKRPVSTVPKPVVDFDEELIEMF